MIDCVSLWLQRNSNTNTITLSSHRWLLKKMKWVLCECMDLRTDTKARTVAGWSAEVIHYPGRAYPRPASISISLLLDLVQPADPLLQLFCRLFSCSVHCISTAASLHQHCPDGSHQPASTYTEKQTQRQSQWHLLRGLYCAKKKTCICFGKQYSFFCRTHTHIQVFIWMELIVFKSSANICQHE